MIQIHIESYIPIASGLGSGAAVTLALARALSEHFHHPLSVQDQSRIAYKIDRLHHGTPSGIDNTVIAHGLPIYFVKGQQPQPIQVGAELPLEPDPRLRVEAAHRLVEEEDVPNHMRQAAITENGAFVAGLKRYFDLIWEYESVEAVR
jgi:mevalonate kinase